MIEFLEMAMKWAWGTLLTAIVTAVLTMFFKHGRRWTRGVRKFIRTGRVKPHVRRNRMPQAQVISQAAMKSPRFSLTTILKTLGQLGQTQTTSAMTTTNAAAPQNSEPLDLKF